MLAIVGFHNPFFALAYFKNRLRRTRRESLDSIKQMKLPEDDEKREREVVEKTLSQVQARNVRLLLHFMSSFGFLCPVFCSYCLA
jgi:hypothetical protein